MMVFNVFMLVDVSYKLNNTPLIFGKSEYNLTTFSFSYMDKNLYVTIASDVFQKR